MRYTPALLILFVFVCTSFAATVSEIKASGLQCKKDCCLGHGNDWSDSTTLCTGGGLVVGQCIDNCYAEAIKTAARQSGKTNTQANALAEQHFQCHQGCCAQAGGKLDVDGSCGGDYQDAELGRCYQTCYDNTLNQAAGSGAGTAWCGSTAALLTIGGLLVLRRTG